MPQTALIKLDPSIANDDFSIRSAIAKKLGVAENSITEFVITKRSIDARGKQPMIQIQADAFINEKIGADDSYKLKLKKVSAFSKKILIVGAGPAGLFAALSLLEQGHHPIIIERGKDVKERRRDLAQLNKKGIVNPDSNYCFGEGGAGTYSDGKLYTRSSKRGDVKKVLHMFVEFGAANNILYDAHPHIGTNKLPQIIMNMRNAIIQHGGEIHFSTKLTDIIVDNDHIQEIQTENGLSFKADAYLLATGHSARDIFYLLLKKNILIESKPLAIGVRIEHPQALINNIQYGSSASLVDDNSNLSYLPPASYSLVQQVQGRGVFSFCMCPGGIVAAAATEPGEVVVNGWSPSKRNNPFANSGLVVEIRKEDVLAELPELDENDPLLFLKYQQQIEQRCFRAAGSDLSAPAQRMKDFTNGKKSLDLPKTSYTPGVTSVNLKEVLPMVIYDTLAAALVLFGKKLKGFLNNDAVVIATESRTSSPIKIPRNAINFQHAEIENLYPCGEGAGYAGGIVSAAMDGQAVATAISMKLEAN